MRGAGAPLPHSGSSMILLPPPKDGNSEWYLTVPAPALEHVALGGTLPEYILVAHDAKGDGPRLSVVRVADGGVHPLHVHDHGRGLAEAQDLECLFHVDVAQQQQQLQHLQQQLAPLAPQGSRLSRAFLNHSPRRPPSPSRSSPSRHPPASPSRLSGQVPATPTVPATPSVQGGTQAEEPRKAPLYCAVTGRGAAFLFKVTYRRQQWVAHSVRPFRLLPPPGRAQFTNIEAGRCYCENGKLYVEYGSRGGQSNGAPVHPWVARYPLDLKAVRQGTFELKQRALDVTYWPKDVDADPQVQQCSSMGQAVSMAKYGQLFSASKCGSAAAMAAAAAAAAAGSSPTQPPPRSRSSTSRAASRPGSASASGGGAAGAAPPCSVSYIMERLSGARAGGEENVKPLYRIRGCRIGAIFDVTRDLSIITTADDAGGYSLGVLHRYCGLLWRVPLRDLPLAASAPTHGSAAAAGSGGAGAAGQGSEPRPFGVCGLAPLDQGQGPSASDSDEEDMEKGPFVQLLPPSALVTQGQQQGEAQQPLRPEGGQGQQQAEHSGGAAAAEEQDRGVTAEATFSSLPEGTADPGEQAEPSRQPEQLSEAAGKQAESGQGRGSGGEGAVEDRLSPTPAAHGETEEDYPPSPRLPALPPPVLPSPALPHPGLTARGPSRNVLPPLSRPSHLPPLRPSTSGEAGQQQQGEGQQQQGGGQQPAALEERE